MRVFSEGVSQHLLDIFCPEQELPARRLVAVFLEIPDYWPTGRGILPEPFTLFLGMFKELFDIQPVFADGC